MSPEVVCPRFKQNAWKKELCSNCFRPKEEHPEKPKRVHVDYKPLPEISPAQSILKVNGSCVKSRNVSFSNVESEVIGYGGEEYSTDEEYSSDEESRSEYLDSEDDDELRRLTEANTNVNSKLQSIVPENSVNCNNNNNNYGPPKAAATVRVGNNTPAKPAQNKSPPLQVTVQPFAAEPPKSLVFNFLKNKELAAATAAKEALQKTADGCKDDAQQTRKTAEATTRKPTTLSRSSLLVANSNEPYLNIRRCSLPAADEQAKTAAPPPPPPPPPPQLPNRAAEIPEVKLHPPEPAVVANADQVNDVRVPAKDPEPDAAAAPYKTRSNVPRMGTMHFKLKLAVASSQKPEPSKSISVSSGTAAAAAAAATTTTAESTPESSLTSREMAGEPDGKADSDEPGDPAVTTTAAAGAVSNRSFLHNFKEVPSPLRDTTNHHCPTTAITGGATISTTPPRTPVKKTSICSNSPPECPRSIKRQAPKPPPLPPSAAGKCGGAVAADPATIVYHSANSSLSDDEFRPDDVTVANRKLLAEYCEQIEKEQSSSSSSSSSPQVRHSYREQADAVAGGEPTTVAARESYTLPLAGGKRPAYEKKKYSKAGKVGLKIKKFLRIPSRESVAAAAAPPQPSPRPKLEIIHPLDINKSAVEIIHNGAADGGGGGGALHARETATVAARAPPPPPANHCFAAARPSKPPPPPRSLPPVSKLPAKSLPSAELIADYPDGPKTCDSSTSDETYEPVNFSAPECDHSSPEMARLTSMQYYGSETESEIYPAIQFGDDFGAEDSIRNTQLGHKSLEESYDAVVIANHEALTKLLDQATCDPKVPKELLALRAKNLEWSSFHVDPTSRLRKSGCAFYNAKWYDVPVVLSVSGERVELNNVLNNHFTLTKVTEFVTRVGKEYAPGAENEDAYVTLWNAHRVEAVESYCKEYNAKYADVTKEAGLILVETVNLLMGLQASDVDRYSLEPFVVTRNSFGADPTVAVVQLRGSDFEEEDTLCEIMLKVLRLLAPTWEMTVCLSQVLRQGKANSLSKCKALLEFWLWGPTGVTAVTPDRPPSLKRWLDLERANELHGRVCYRGPAAAAAARPSVEQICYMSFLVHTDDRQPFSDAWMTLHADRKTRPPRDPTISKC